ncbi:MAG: hypothetical protein HFG36_09935 [Eubacterium sp.]|nr:hypothetical protein [Eubacterium sp.]
MVGILINYKENRSGQIKNSYMEGNDYESVLKKFLLVKGGKDKVSIESIQDWDRKSNQFTREHPITKEDKDGVVYQVMKEED